MKTPDYSIRSWLLGAIVTVAVAVVALAPKPAQAGPTPNAPGQISYQGFLTDANGVPLATNAPKNYDVIFHIYNSPNSSTPLWGELQTVTVDRGASACSWGKGPPWAMVFLPPTI